MNLKSFSELFILASFTLVLCVSKLLTRIFSFFFRLLFNFQGPFCASRFERSCSISHYSHFVNTFFKTFFNFFKVFLFVNKHSFSDTQIVQIQQQRQETPAPAARGSFSHIINGRIILQSSHMLQAYSYRSDRASLRTWCEHPWEEARASPVPRRPFQKESHCCARRERPLQN